MTCLSFVPPANRRTFYTLAYNSGPKSGLSELQRLSPRAIFILTGVAKSDTNSYFHLRRTRVSAHTLICPSDVLLFLPTRERQFLASSKDLEAGVFRVFFNNCECGGVTKVVQFKKIGVKMPTLTLISHFSEDATSHGSGWFCGWII